MKYTGAWVLCLVSNQSTSKWHLSKYTLHTLHHRSAIKCEDHYRLGEVDDAERLGSVRRSSAFNAFSPPHTIGTHVTRPENKVTTVLMQKRLGFQTKSFHPTVGAWQKLQLCIRLWLLQAPVGSTHTKGVIPWVGFDVATWLLVQVWQTSVTRTGAAIKAGWVVPQLISARLCLDPPLLL